MASVRSLDNALETGNDSVIPGAKITSDTGVTQIPDNGRIIRNLIHGADTVMSHITHFYQLAALDFVDASYLGAPFSPGFNTTTPGLISLLPADTHMSNGIHVVTNYIEALAMRRKAQSASAIFSGRHPIQNAIVPGGVTTLPTASDITTFAGLLDTVRNFVNTAYVPDVVTVANIYSTYWTLGTQPGNLLSYGEYPIQRGTGGEKLLLGRGLVTLTGSTLGFGSYASTPTAFLSNVKEYVGYSYYDIGELKQNDELAPANGVTIPDVSLVAASTGQQYSWLKAPRFDGRVCEVGPIARMVATFANSAAFNPVMSGAKSVSSTLPFTFNAFSTLTGTYTLSGLVVAALGMVSGAASNLVSILGRHACRALECKVIADAMADSGLATTSTTTLPSQQWLTELRAGTTADSTGTVMTNLTNPVYVYAKLPTKPKTGAGWAEAPRGALGHWISIEKKRIANYQCVVPSTWNHSPRDTAGKPGAAEAVLQGLPSSVVDAYLSSLLNNKKEDLYVTILRVLHTYDFCIACAVHVVKPDGSTIAKFKMETDGRVTKLPHDAEI
jgi:hydrogenase large subunit